MADIEAILSKLTADETEELVEQALEILPQERALVKVRSWLEGNDLQNEIEHTDE